MSDKCRHNKYIRKGMEGQKEVQNEEQMDGRMHKIALLCIYEVT